jgi:hypothetical protein
MSQILSSHASDDAIVDAFATTWWSLPWGDYVAASRQCALTAWSASVRHVGLDVPAPQDHVRDGTGVPRSTAGNHRGLDARSWLTRMLKSIAAAGSGSTATTNGVRPPSFAVGASVSRRDSYSLGPRCVVIRTPRDNSEAQEAPHEIVVSLWRRSCAIVRLITGRQDTPAQLLLPVAELDRQGRVVTS